MSLKWYKERGSNRHGRLHLLDSKNDALCGMGGKATHKSEITWLERESNNPEKQCRRCLEAAGKIV